MDMNADGSIDVSDVNLLINVVLGKSSLSSNVQQDVFYITGKAGMNVLGLHAKEAGDLVIRSLKVEAAK